MKEKASAPPSRSQPTRRREFFGRAAREVFFPHARIWPKLRIGEPGDRFEREADRVADEVVEGAAAPSIDAGGAARQSEPMAERQVRREPQVDEERLEEDLPEPRRRLGLKELSPGAPATGEGPPEPSGREVDGAVSALSASGRPIPQPSRAFFERSFGVGFDDVRVHTGDRAARLASSWNARAFAYGNDVVFAEGEYRPESGEGRRLLAHELAHVVQQRVGTGERRIQRRRVPDIITTLDLVLGQNAAAHEAGLREVVRRAWAELTPAQQTAVRTRAMGGFSVAEARAMPQLDRDVLFAHAIRSEVPGLIGGDPSLYQIGARPGTADAANIATLTGGANRIFAAIAAGTHDASIGQIFGAANVTTAKARYAAARTRMNFLEARNKIVSDRSGYSGEVGLGGLTTSAQIMVSPDTIDNPGDSESVVMMIHEAMHAGNASVTDLGYIDRAEFPRMQAADKLNNAAHYEVVPRRILGTADFTFAGQTFTPAGGTTPAGTTAPALTPREQAVRATSETFRKAWNIGLNLHDLFVEAFTHPSGWTVDVSPRFLGVVAGTSFADSLPFWSKVENLTVHRKTHIDPASSDVSKHPVSLLDLALSEGLIRRLSRAMGVTPQTEGEALALEAAHATSAELTAIAGSVTAETDLLLKLVLEHSVGSITGDALRDRRVVKRMAQATTGDYSDMIVTRPPSAFP